MGRMRGRGGALVLDWGGGRRSEVGWKGPPLKWITGEIRVWCGLQGRTCLKRIKRGWGASRIILGRMWGSLIVGRG